MSTKMAYFLRGVVIVIAVGVAFLLTYVTGVVDELRTLLGFSVRRESSELVNMYWLVMIMALVIEFTWSAMLRTVLRRVTLPEIFQIKWSMLELFAILCTALVLTGIVLGFTTQLTTTLTVITLIAAVVMSLFALRRKLSRP